MLTELAKKNKRVVGMKQTLKVIDSNQATKVYIAQDIDQQIKDKIIKASQTRSVLIEAVESKLTLGRACGIDVSAACAAVLK